MQVQPCALVKLETSLLSWGFPDTNHTLSEVWRRDLSVRKNDAKQASSVTEAQARLGFTETHNCHTVGALGGTWESL